VGPHVRSLPLVGPKDWRVARSKEAAPFVTFSIQLCMAQSLGVKLRRVSVLGTGGTWTLVVVLQFCVSRLCDRASCEALGA